jgi:hypothetical protein
MTVVGNILPDVKMVVPLPVWPLGVVKYEKEALKKDFIRFGSAFSFLEVF